MPKLTVVTGPMGAGKTTELVRRVRRAEICGVPTLLYKYAGDTRWDTSALATHAGEKKGQCRLVTSLVDEPLPPPSTLVVIDEAQFIVGAASWAVAAADLADVCVGILSSDFLQRPFDQFAEFCLHADELIKLPAICPVCKKDAIYTIRLGSATQVEVIGGMDAYQARCRLCL
jgi:thymidine kinase